MPANPPSMRGASHVRKMKPAAPDTGDFAIIQFGYDAPRLIRVAKENRIHIYGRDHLQGGMAMVRQRDVLFRHADEALALQAVEAVREIARREDEKLAAAWRRYARVQAGREAALLEAARSGTVPS